MTPIRQRMIEDMLLRNFSPHAQDAYVRAVAQFTRHFMLPPETLTADHVRHYLLHLVQKRHVAWSTYNQVRCGLQFFFRTNKRDGTNKRDDSDYPSLRQINSRLSRFLVVPFSGPGRSDPYRTN